VSAVACAMSCGARSTCDEQNMGLFSRSSQSLTPRAGACVLCAAGVNSVTSTPTISESSSAIVVHARGACDVLCFTKRVGFANMHHDGVAKRDLSWAWRQRYRRGGVLR
jgi:hypothetical protein